MPPVFMPPVPGVPPVDTTPPVPGGEPPLPPVAGAPPVGVPPKPPVEGDPPDGVPPDAVNPPAGDVPPVAAVPPAPGAPPDVVAPAPPPPPSGASAGSLQARRRRRGLEVRRRRFIASSRRGWKAEDRTSGRRARAHEDRCRRAASPFPLPTLVDHKNAPASWRSRRGSCVTCELSSFEKQRSAGSFRNESRRRSIVANGAGFAHAPPIGPRRHAELSPKRDVEQRGGGEAALPRDLGEA